MAGEVLDLVRSIMERPVRQRLLQEQLETSQEHRRQLRGLEEERAVQTERSKQELKKSIYEFDLTKDTDLDTTLNHRFVGATYKLENNLPLDSDDQTAFVTGMYRENRYFKEKSFAQLDDLNKDLKTIDSEFKRLTPVITQQAGKRDITEKKRIIIDKDQAPELFAALQGTHGDIFNLGTDRTGKKAQSKILSKLYLDLDNGTITPHFDIVDSEGKPYSSPATEGRTADPNGQVLRIPIGIFVDQFKGLSRMSDHYTALRLKLGDKGMQEEFKKSEAVHKESLAFRKADDAVDVYKEKHPDATPDDFRRVYSQAAIDAGLERKVVDEHMNYRWPKPTEETKFQKETTEGRAESRKLKARELDIKEKELGEKRTERKETREEKAKERKEKEAEKPLSVTEQREFNNEMFSRYSGLIHKEEDARDEIIKSKSLDRLLSAFPDQQRELVRDIRDRATELKQQDRKLTWNQAITQAEKEIGKPEKILKPIPSSEIEDIVKKFKDMPKGPGKLKKMEEEAKKRGWDPNKKE
jgi:hypothetical protein